MDMMGPVSLAKADNLDIEDYLDYDFESDDEGDYALGERVSNGDGTMPMHFDQMSQYYDRMGPQVAMDEVQRSNAKESEANAADYGYNYENEYGDESGGEEAELTDSFFYHQFNDYQDYMDAQWNAADFYDADYDSESDASDFEEKADVDAAHESEMGEMYDYSYLMDDYNEEEEEEEGYIHGLRHIDSRWVRHADDPERMVEIQHPQQQKWEEHNLFIYNNYDDDIRYQQKKYNHPAMAEEESESESEEDEWAIPVVWDGMDSYIEINSNMFWLLSLFAVFFGIMLCSMLFCYLKEREKFKRELSKQFGIPVMMQKCGGEKAGKYGFNAINMALSHGEHSGSECDSYSDHGRSADELMR